MRSRACSACDPVLFTFSLFFVWLHILAVVVWIGGIVYTAYVAGPLLRSPDYSSPALLERLVHRFQRLSRELLYVILVTGVFNMIFRGTLIEFRFSSKFLTFVGVKFTLLLVIAALQVYYSLKLIPQIADAANSPSEQAPDASRKLNRKAHVVSALMVALAVVIVYLGLSLRYV